MKYLRNARSCSFFTFIDQSTIFTVKMHLGLRRTLSEKDDDSVIAQPLLMLFLEASPPVPSCV